MKKIEREKFGRGVSTNENKYGCLFMFAALPFIFFLGLLTDNLLIAYGLPFGVAGILTLVFTARADKEDARKQKQEAAKAVEYFFNNPPVDFLEVFNIVAIRHLNQRVEWQKNGVDSTDIGKPLRYKGITIEPDDEGKYLLFSKNGVKRNYSVTQKLTGVDLWKFYNDFIDFYPSELQRLGKG